MFPSASLTTGSVMVRRTVLAGRMSGDVGPELVQRTGSTAQLRTNV